MGFASPGSFITGTDITIVITSTNPNIGGLTVSLDGRRERFTSEYDDKIEVGAGCDNGGVIDSRRIPGTITGTLEFYKQNSNFGAIMAALDQAFYNQQGETAFTITVYIPVMGPNGTFTGQTNSFQYSNLKFHKYASGDYVRDTKTKCQVQFTASLLTQLT